MKIELTIQKPVMPDHLSIEGVAGARQDGFSLLKTIPVKDLTSDQAHEYAETLKDAFLNHWFVLTEPTRAEMKKA